MLNHTDAQAMRRGDQQRAGVSNRGTASLRQHAGAASREQRLQQLTGSLGTAVLVEAFNLQFTQRAQVLDVLEKLPGAFGVFAKK